MMKELHKYSALELGDLVNRKQISTKEVLDYFKERIESATETAVATAFDLLDHFDIDHTFDSIFSCVGQIGIFVCLIGGKVVSGLFTECCGTILGVIFFGHGTDRIGGHASGDHSRCHY